jgi:hypothetical protein
LIHIATIHWPTSRWIDIQQYYLKKNISEEFSCFAVIHVKSEQEATGFEYIKRSVSADHAKHLNHLQSEVIKSASGDDDILVFLDGDAFPVIPLDEHLKNWLEKAPLVAIQRPENDGEFLPHPGFSAARIRTWKELGACWGPSRTVSGFGRDPGGGLYDRIEELGIGWVKLLRTNRYNLHPLFFGIYQDVLYHHGAGFREPISRIDMVKEGLGEKRKSPASRISEILPNRFFLPVKRRISPFRKAEYRIILRNRVLHEEVFEQIRSDRDFYKRFT